MQKLLLPLLLVAIFSAALRADELTGVVVDQQGQPLAGVRIDISTAGPKIGKGIFCPSCYLDCRKFAKTDEAGKFKLTSLDASLKFHLLASLPGKKTLQTDWVDPATGATTITMQDFPKTDAAHLLLGRVVDHQGTPVPGALIEPCGGKQGGKRWRGSVNEAEPAVTDDQGKFQVLLTGELEAVDLEILADGSSGIIAKQLIPGDTVHQVIVPTGTKVTGRLVQQGKPAPNQPVAVVQLNRSGGQEIFIASVLATSNADGRFEFENLPPSQMYAIFTPRGVPSTGLVIKTARFQALDNNESRDLGTLELNPGFTLAGKFLLPDGESFPDNTSIGLGRDAAWDLISVPVNNAGEFRIENLPPETYEIGFRSEILLLDETRSNFHLLNERGFALRLSQDVTNIEIPLRTLRSGEPSMKVVYESTRDIPAGSQSISGIVVDREGKPLSGISVFPVLTGNYYRFGDDKIRTAADGKFLFESLPDHPMSIKTMDLKARGNILSGGGAIIPYPGLVRTQSNQQDLRIIFDKQIFSELPEIK